MMTRRPYQNTALQKIKKRLLQGYNRLLVKWPTGMGKTVLFAGLPETLELATRLMTGKRHRMLVLVHREELIKQAADKIRAWNPKITIGVEKAQKYAGNEQVVIASVATLGRAGSTRIARFIAEHFGAVVVDEAHHATASTYQRVLKHFNVWADLSILLLGVTATPNRADGVGLGDTFQEIVDDITLLDAINQGWLVNIRGVRVSTGQSLDNVEMWGKDFDVGSLGAAINTPQRNDLVVREWKSAAGGEQTVAFCADVQHAIDLAAAFNSYGVKADAVWGENDEDERSGKLRRHAKKQSTVLCNCGVLTEGYDDWQVGCIILARPTKSEGLYTQMVGRGTRIPDDIAKLGLNLVEARSAGLTLLKSECLVMDFADATVMHSLVTLPSLIGLSAEMDMKGLTVTEVAAEVEELRKRKPTFDVSTLKDADKIKGVAQEVDLLKVTYAPEVIQYSDYQWHKTGPSAYVLLLLKGEHVVVMSDVLEKWHVSGTVSGRDLFGVKHSLEAAIKWADQEIRRLGGVGLVSCIKREAAWHDLPPKPAQLQLARNLGLRIPPEATRGEVSKKLNEALAAKKNAAFGRIYEAAAKIEAKKKLG